MSDSGEHVDLSHLPEWVRKAFDAAMRAAQQSAPSILDHRGSSAWSLFVDAAVVMGFLPRDLAAGVVEGDSRGDAEKAVLDFAEWTHSPDGARWSLTREARTAILGAAGSDEIVAALKRTGSRFTDSVTRALHDCFRGQTDLPAATSDLGALEARRIAVGLLAGTPNLTLPSLDALDRDIALKRLLAHFERMTGVVPSTDPSSATRPDRFFGRAGDMEKLRAHVDVVASSSVRETVVRAAQRVALAFLTDRTPLNVWGVGGVGKTTLIAKFMLQHARAAASRFPFAYLDFDRATVSARNRAGLLIEMASQVGAQFPELHGGMRELIREVRELARKLEASSSGESIGELAPSVLKFRNQIDGYLEGQEGFLQSTRPFLLVFDTFEVVQYTRLDVGRLEELVRAFSPPGANAWPRLRLVISGRRQVSTFTGDVTALRLGALDREGSEQMLAVLAADAGRAISAKDGERLVSAIARRVGGRDKGVHPLRLRLVGELFRRSTKPDGTVIDGPAIVASLVDEFSKPPSAKSQTGAVLVDGILVRRILNHIKDPRVRALSDPGLVVRRITPDVIRQVMAPGTTPPGRDDPGDSLDIVPWVIDDAEARDIFEAFKGEGSLVEEDEQSLRHRQDVREEMLLLIRASRPNRFRALHEKAYEYFKRRAESDPSDDEAAAETIYHGLWLELPLATLDRFWRPDPRFNPRIEPSEFEPASAAAIYLRARMTKEPLTSEEIGRLPHSVALDWLVGRSEHLLADPEVNQGVEAMRVVAGRGFEALDAHVGVAAVAARLLLRAGFWHDAATLVGRHLAQVSPQGLTTAGQGHEAAFVSMLRTRATLAAKSASEAETLHGLLPFAESVRDPLVRVELLAHVAIGLTRVSGSTEPVPGLRDTRLREAIRRVPPESWRQELRILRLAILTATHPVPDLLRIYFEALHRLPRDAALRAPIARVFGAVRDRIADRSGSIETLLADREHSEVAATRLDEIWRGDKRPFLEAIASREDLAGDFWHLVAFDHHDWAYSLGASLSREGTAVFGAFEYSQPLWNWWGQLRSLPPDGLSIVQSALDFGLLLEVADAISGLRRGREATASRSGYPQDIFGLATAFTEWHRTIVERLAPSRPDALA